jgi:hypothetical protein
LFGACSFLRTVGVFYVAVAVVVVVVVVVVVFFSLNLLRA